MGLQSLGHRVRDEVGEADLAATGSLEVPVEDLPVDLQELGGDLADAGRRGDPQRLLHPLGDDAGGSGKRFPTRGLAAALGLRFADTFLSLLPRSGSLLLRGAHSRL